MHVGIVTSEFPPHLGGVETYAAEYAKALAALGHRVSVLLHVTHDVSEPVDGLALFPVLRFSRRIDRRVLAQFDVDAWHGMNAAHGWIALETHKPVVVSIHGNDFLRPYPRTGNPRYAESHALWRLRKALGPLEKRAADPLTRRLLHRSLPRAAGILSNSRYTEEVFLRQFPECEGKTVVARVGVSDRFLAVPLERHPNDPPVLLTVSRLSEPRKNVDRVIEALAGLKETHDFRYHVIGDGDQLPRLRELVTAHGLEDRVSLLGRQPFAAIMRHMQRSDLFILTSSTTRESHEGFGIVYLEAAASGTPSLATRQAGAAEAVSEGESGFFVEEPTIEGIRHALARFLDGELAFDPQSCRDFAKQFTWRSVVEKALPYYHSGT